MSMDMMALRLGLRNRGGGVYACIDGVSTDGDGRVECFRVEVLEVNGVVRSGHWIRRVSWSAKGLKAWLGVVERKRREFLFWTLRSGRGSGQWGADLEMD